MRLPQLLIQEWITNVSKYRFSTAKQKMLSNAAMSRTDCRKCVAPSWINTQPVNTHEKNKIK